MRCSETRRSETQCEKTSFEKVEKRGKWRGGISLAYHRLDLKNKFWLLFRMSRSRVQLSESSLITSNDWDWDMFRAQAKKRGEQNRHEEKRKKKPQRSAKKKNTTHMTRIPKCVSLRVSKPTLALSVWDDSKHQEHLIMFRKFELTNEDEKIQR
jgi:hypothetical protein